MRTPGVEETTNRAGTMRPKMWQAIRSFPSSFSIADVGMVTGVKVGAVLNFLNGLRRVGVVQKIINDSGLPGSFARYQLVRDLGPKTPIVRRVWTVYDPNSKQSLQRINPIQEEL